tara:strand:+ start:414 stop:770 length:357 start_codon:yes stop_codon:yes gene_type:complete
MSFYQFKSSCLVLCALIADCTSWLLGLIVLTLALILGMYAHALGLGLLLIALLLLPFSRRFIEAKTACRLSWQVRMTLILIIAVLMVLLSPSVQSFSQMWHDSAFHYQSYSFHSSSVS